MCATDDDYDLLATSVLNFIELVVDLESKGHFPSYEKVNKLVEDKEEMKYFSAKVPKKDGSIRIPPPADTEAVGTFSCSFETKYDANKATVDVPMKEDLASDKTLEMLLAYSETLADNALKGKNEEEDNEDFPPIMSNLSPYLLGDGNPIWGIYKLLKKAGDSKYKRRMPAFFGGFHLVLETHKKRGALFGGSHLREFLEDGVRVIKCWIGSWTLAIQVKLMMRLLCFI